MTEISSTLGFKLNFDAPLTVKEITDSLNGLDSIIKSAIPITNKVFKTKFKYERLSVASIEEGSFDSLLNLVLKSKTFQDMSPAKKTWITVAALVGAGVLMYAIKGPSLNIGDAITGDNNQNNTYNIDNLTVENLTVNLREKFPDDSMDCALIAEQVVNKIQNETSFVKKTLKQVSRISHPGGTPITGMELNIPDEATGEMKQITLATQSEVSSIPKLVEEPEYKEHKALFKDILLNVIDMNKNVNDDKQVAWTAVVMPEEGNELTQSKRTLLVESESLQKQLFPILGKPFRADIYAVYVIDKKGGRTYLRYILKEIR